jgi:hypothetical protein
MRGYGNGLRGIVIEVCQATNSSFVQQASDVPYKASSEQGSHLRFTEPYRMYGVRNEGEVLACKRRQTPEAAAYIVSFISCLNL